MLPHGRTARSEPYGHVQVVEHDAGDEDGCEREQAGGGSQCECRAAGLDALHRQAGYRECDRAYDEMRADDSRIGRRERAGCELVVRDGGKALLVQCEHDGPRHERERRQYDESALERALVVLAALALVAGTVVLALHQESLSAIANNEFAASTLAPSYPAVIGAHLIVGAIALAIAGLSMKRVQSRRTTLALRATASLLALAAVFVTRIVFYHLHMTVGF